MRSHKAFLVLICFRGATAPFILISANRGHQFLMQQLCHTKIDCRDCFLRYANTTLEIDLQPQNERKKADISSANMHTAYTEHAGIDKPLQGCHEWKIQSAANNDGFVWLRFLFYSERAFGPHILHVACRLHYICIHLSNRISETAYSEELRQRNVLLMSARELSKVLKTYCLKSLKNHVAQIKSCCSFLFYRVRRFIAAASRQVHACFLKRSVWVIIYTLQNTFRYLLLAACLGKAFMHDRDKCSSIMLTVMQRKPESLS